jgi:hypothetical protein
MEYSFNSHNRPNMVQVVKLKPEKEKTNTNLPYSSLILFSDIILMLTDYQLINCFDHPYFGFFSKFHAYTTVS